jgi:hypothetical protein
MKDKFLMRVCNRLLIKLRMAGIEPSEASVFFGTQAEAMLDCQPNYGPNSTKTTTAPHHQLKKSVWLMRGFYPNSPLMFKISISENDHYDTYQYYVKVTEPAVRIPSKRGERGLEFTSRYESSFSSKQLRDQLQNRLEKEVLGIDLNIEPLVSNKVVFTPKCISPKGMPFFRLSYKKD